MTLVANPALLVLQPVDQRGLRELVDAIHLSLHSGARRFRQDTTDLSVVERTTIVKVLRDCRGNKTKAARRRGLSRTQLHGRIRKYRLEEAAAA